MGYRLMLTHPLQRTHHGHAVMLLISVVGLSAPCSLKCTEHQAVQQAMGALGGAEEVTPLGEHLTAMPVDPR